MPSYLHDGLGYPTDTAAEAECWASGSRLLVPDVADHEDILLTDEVFASALGVGACRARVRPDFGVNCWSAIGFLLGYTPWGAYPGHTRQAIGSGRLPAVFASALRG